MGVLEVRPGSSEKAARTLNDQAMSPSPKTIHYRACVPILLLELYIRTCWMPNHRVLTFVNKETKVMVNDNPFNRYMHVASSAVVENKAELCLVLIVLPQ